MFLYSRASRLFRIGGKYFWLEKCRPTDSVFELMKIKYNLKHDRNLNAIVIHNSNADLGCNSNTLVF